MASTPPFPAANEELRCARHPETPTRLRCTRCARPICPRCFVRTPVGLRCDECAGVRALPTYTAAPNVLLKAASAAMLVAIAVGVIWAQIPSWGFYLALLLGFGVAETIARLAGDKRGRELQAIGLVAVVFALTFSRWLIFRDYGVTFADYGDLTEQGQRVLRVRLVPDGIFALMPILIVWYRFK